MYTNPVQTYHFGQLTTPLIEIEGAADICALQGRTSDAGTGTTASLDSVTCPFGGQIEGFGIVVTEALTGAHATKCVLKCQALAADGTTVTAAGAMSIPGQASDVTVANAYASDQAAGAVTQAQAVAIGARFISSSTSLPYTVEAGGSFYMEVTTAAGTAGGAFRAYTQFRHNGPPSPGAAADSPVTKLAS